MVDPSQHQPAHPANGRANLPHPEAHAAAFSEELLAGVRTALEKESGVAWAPSLTSYDLQIAALNGLSPEINYIVPPFPRALSELPVELAGALRGRGVPADGLVVLRDENPFLFLHCLHACAAGRGLSEQQLRDTTALGLLSIAPGAHAEYLDLLQQTARAFRDGADRYFDPLAEVVAAQAAQTIRRGGQVLGASDPMIKVCAPHPDGVLLTAAGSMQLVQRLAPGSTVFIPGAGYNSLLDIAAMAQCTGASFVVNDRDPFAGAVLERTIDKLRPPNVRFVKGEMDEAAARIERIDAVLIGNLYSSKPHELRRLCAAVLKHAPPGTPVHVLQVEGEGAEIKSTGRSWAAELRAAGYGLFCDWTFPLAPLVAREVPQSRLIEFGATELTALLREPTPAAPPQRSASYLIAHTPRAAGAAS